MKNKIGKIITVTSSKGGVGKTIFLLNLAGILSKMNQKILIVDADFVGGSIALNLNLDSKKNVFHISDDILSNHYRSYDNYTTKYTDNIDIVPSPKDPRQSYKINMDYVLAYLEDVKKYYDLILVDTTHGLTRENILLLDKSDTILYIMTNDIMDIKNTKSFIELADEVKLDNIKIVLNNSRDVGLNYFSKYDIKSMINRNIDYSVDNTLYIKNITSFILEGEIFTLNNSLTFKDKNDLKKLEIMANDLIGSED